MQYSETRVTFRLSPQSSPGIPNTGLEKFDNSVNFFNLRFICYCGAGLVCFTLCIRDLRSVVEGAIPDRLKGVKT